MRLTPTILSLSLITALCFSSKALAQSDYLEGYIILEGDTLTGWVKDRSPEPFTELYSKIRFKPNDSKKRKKYSPNQIDGYGRGNDHFVSVPLKEESAFFIFRYYLNERYDRIFLKRIRQNGPLTYYEKEYVHDDNDYLDAYPFFYLRGKFEMVRVTQGILGLKKQSLTEYFAFCPPLVKAIQNEDLKTTLEVFDFFGNNCAN